MPRMTPAQARAVMDRMHLTPAQQKALTARIDTAERTLREGLDKRLATQRGRVDEELGRRRAALEQIIQHAEQAKTQAGKARASDIAEVHKRLMGDFDRATVGTAALMEKAGSWADSADEPDEAFEAYLGEDPRRLPDFVGLPDPIFSGL